MKNKKKHFETNLNNLIFYRFSLFTPDFRLNAAILARKTVSERTECIIECVKEPCCRSINYRKTLCNETNCEMLHNVVYNTSEKLLEKSSSYDHVYLTNPHKVRFLHWATVELEIGLRSFHFQGHIILYNYVKFYTHFGTWK